MFVSLFFWLALLLPGYVLARRLWPDDLRTGFLSLISLSYLAVFTLLSPVSILCYLTGCPVAVFSAACVLAVLAGAAVVTWRRWWRDLGRLIFAGLCVELLILVADLVAGGRIGGFMAGDSQVHLARIRSLLELGFNNRDPYVEFAAFFPVYHTNLLHALQAACAQLTGVDYLSAWSASLVWAKLVITAGMYYLAWCIFGRVWAAWAAALFLLGWNCTIDYSLYPNQLGAYWLIPLALAAAVQLCCSPPGWPTVMKLSAVTLVLGQFHALCAFFAGLVIAPTFGGLLLWRLWRRQPARWPLVAGLAALGLGAPFVLATKLAGSLPPESASAPVPPDDNFHYCSNGWLMLKPALALGGRGSFGLGFLAAGGAIALLTPRRRPAAVLVVAAATAALVLFAPPVCTLASNTFGRPWMVARLSSVHVVAAAALLPGALGWLLEARMPLWWVRALVNACLAVGGLAFAAHPQDYSWANHVRHLRLPAQLRRIPLHDCRRAREFFRAEIEPGSLVLTDGRTGRWLVMLHNCHILAPDRGSPAADAQPERVQALQSMMTLDVPWPLCRELLQKYDVRYYLQGGKRYATPRWVPAHAADVRKFYLDRNPDAERILARIRID